MWVSIWSNILIRLNEREKSNSSFARSTRITCYLTAHILKNLWNTISPPAVLFNEKYKSVITHQEIQATNNWRDVSFYLLDLIRCNRRNRRVVDGESSIFLLQFIVGHLERRGQPPWRYVAPRCSALDRSQCRTGIDSCLSNSKEREASYTIETYAFYSRVHHSDWTFSIDWRNNQC